MIFILKLQDKLTSDIFVPGVSTESDEKSTWNIHKFLISYEMVKIFIPIEKNEEEKVPDLLNKDLKEAEEEHVNLYTAQFLPH